MLDNVVVFDPSTRVRDLELSVTRRLREALRPHVEDHDALEAAVRDALVVARDFAYSFHAVQDRARARSETQ